MTTIKFGTDGWRAEIARSFTFANVKAVAQAIADYLNSHAKNRKPKVVVGYDTRFLSDRYAKATASVLVANGIEVLLADRPTPTPAVTYAIKDRSLAGGVMITASHNPARFNGIKFKTHEAAPADESITKAIEEYLFKNKTKEIPLEDLSKYRGLKVEDLLSSYVKFIRSYLDMPLLRKSKIRALIDSMHGCADKLIERILKNTPNSITTLHPHPDPSFGGVNPEPLDYNLLEMASVIRKGRFDLGVANDGDADRVAAMEPNGIFISGQIVLCLLLLHLVEGRKWRGGVVKSLQSTALIEKIAQKYNLKTFTTPVGFKHISKIMREEDVILGGEESGGISFKNYMPERDGILSGLLLIEMLAHRGEGIKKVLSKIEQEFGSYHYGRKDIRLSQALRDRLVATIEKDPPNELMRKKVVNVVSCGGIKFELENAGWLYLRLSGTEPLLRICAEAETPDDVRRLIREGEALASDGYEGAD